MVDTCCDPTPVDYVIPANDDAAKSVECVLTALCAAIQEGLDERKLEKDKEAAEAPAEEAAAPKAEKTLRSRRTKKAEEAAPAAEPVAEAAAPAEEVESK
jgi:small subunit ribosomal protein S2